MLKITLLVTSLSCMLIGLSQQPAWAGGNGTWFEDQSAAATKCADDYLAQLKAKGITVTMTEYYKNYGDCSFKWSQEHVEDAKYQ
jgi:hypothetical protein